ncbi:MAG: cyclase family protein, partial [Promethearchaeota archaeon]
MPVYDREKQELIDLTLPIYPFQADFVGSPEVKRWNHQEGARINARHAGINPKDFPEGMSQAWEELTITTHLGTHLDAPWHFYPTTGGEPSKRIEDVPLEECIGDGVILNMIHKKPKSLITEEDVKEALDKIEYTLKPHDIVMIRTDYDKKWGTDEYFEEHPGMGKESTEYILDQGVKTIGIDTFGFDRPFGSMGDDYKKTGDKSVLWPAHNVGKEREYYHIERLANLRKVPVSHGFTVVVAPFIIERASAGWTRAFAIVDKERK